MNALLVRDPQIYLGQEMPATASFETGKRLFLTTCSQCHGLAGDGTGWDGQYLAVQPANLADPAMQDMTDGLYLTRLTFGVINTAMPTWGEWLPESQRWDIIRFLEDSFRDGLPTLPSLYGSGDTGTNLLTLSPDNWTGEGHTISTDNGQQVYSTYCATCHGDAGQGDGPGAQNLPSGGPVAYAPDMPLAYIYWRVWEGVSGSVMPPFRWRLSDTDVWDVTSYVQNMVATSSGGGQ